MSAMILGGFLFFSVSIGAQLPGSSLSYFSIRHRDYHYCAEVFSRLTCARYHPFFLSNLSIFRVILGIFVGYFIFQLLDTLFHASHAQNPSVSINTSYDYPYNTY